GANAVVADDAEEQRRVEVGVRISRCVGRVGRGFGRAVSGVGLGVGRAAVARAAVGSARRHDRGPRGGDESEQRCEATSRHLRRAQERLEAGKLVTQGGAELRDAPPFGRFDQLCAKLETDVSYTYLGALIGRERAARGSAERAPGVIAARRLEVTRANAGERERRDLRGRKQIERARAAASAAGPMPVRLGALLRAAVASFDVGEGRGHRDAQLAQAARARDRFRAGFTRARLRTKTSAELDELVLARARLARTPQ